VGDPGVDVGHPLHPPRPHAGLQVGVDRPLGLGRAARQRLALAGRLVEISPDDALHRGALFVVVLTHRLKG
jgi:hypothetical protein